MLINPDELQKTDCPQKMGPAMIAGAIAAERAKSLDGLKLVLDELERSQTCHGGACGAFRWCVHNTHDGTVQAGSQRACMAWLERQRESGMDPDGDNVLRGYCGMAGRPVGSLAL